ncbi:GTPase ObgE [Spiroplasma gladiatoris]|uniref:GTPase ObgE n=1 Tax=Spiroplasma gladiatoris TaxID=2143 RepID=A0A4V1AQE0_9MOLU|nr:Obg family GTPase CgtA [Spiroplasma gladiatoris]QBQ08169.1 GTPase ObgE [Spiroplasma gladiatoris]
MRFIDVAKIHLIAGNGGNGALSFDEFKGNTPNGGNGGNGGDIILICDSNLKTLMDLKNKKIYIAKNGSNGDIKNKHGKNAKSIFLKVPNDTEVYDENNNYITTINKENSNFIVAKGGKGGFGNLKFKKDKTDKYKFEKGQIGQNIKIKLETKVLADVGFVGLPNAGKSTMLRAISNSKPEVADYPFTTLKPHVGISKDKYNRSFIVADLPGLIKGAYLGKGLGIEFLNHIKKCKIICHIIDMSIKSIDNNIIRNYNIIKNELKNFDLDLLNKKEIIIANKMDMEGSINNFNLLKETTGDKIIIPTSGVSKQNIEKLLIEIANMLEL